MAETENNMAGIAVSMLRTLNSVGMYPIMFLEIRANCFCIFIQWCNSSIINMSQIYQGKHSVFYGQITLLVEGMMLFEPDWQTGLEPAIFDSNKYAVAISTANNTEIVVTVCDSIDNLPANLQQYASGELSIGESGLRVGDFTTGHTPNFMYSAGSVTVDIYKDSSHASAVREIAILFTSVDK